MSRVKKSMPQKKYPYAVMDGNEAPDTYRYAVSCHHTLNGAKRAAAKMNAENPNNHYYVIPWNATRWARERPSPNHPEGL